MRAPAPEILAAAPVVLVGFAEVVVGLSEVLPVLVALPVLVGVLLKEDIDEFPWLGTVVVVWLERMEVEVVKVVTVVTVVELAAAVVSELTAEVAVLDWVPTSVVFAPMEVLGAEVEALVVTSAVDVDLTEDSMEKRPV